MGRILRLVIGVMMVLTLGACALSDSFGDVDREPMSDFEINRYRYEFYLKMVPAQRNYYEGLDRPWVIGHSGEGIRPHAASAT